MSLNGEVSFLTPSAVNRDVGFYSLLWRKKFLYIPWLVYEATKLGSHWSDEIAKKDTRVKESVAHEGFLIS